MGTTTGTVLWAFVMLLLFGFFALLDDDTGPEDRDDAETPPTRRRPWRRNHR